MPLWSTGRLAVEDIHAHLVKVLKCHLDRFGVATLVVLQAMLGKQQLYALRGLWMSVLGHGGE